MNYTKLTLSITAGILIAAGIIFAAVEIPEYRRQKRIQERFALETPYGQALKCARDGCVSAEQAAYNRYLKLVSKKLASIKQAAGGFCGDTAAISGNPERNAQLVAECQAPTEKRMAEDLK